MRIVKGVLGFIWNIVMMISYSLSLSVDVAKLCYREDKFPWEMSDIEIAEKLSEMDE